MEEYIVKVKSCLDNDSIEFGTGIVVGDNLILTPAHVVVGEKHYICISGKEVEAVLEKTHNGFALLQTNEILTTKATLFSDDEILDDESEWNIHGFISEIQIQHEISGKGFHVNEVHNDSEDWNCILQNITSGTKNNYRGLSGSPVFSNNRIVGVLQRQEIVDSGIAELKMATVHVFKELLPSDVIAGNEYKIRLFEMVTEHTVDKIEKNKSNRKYIPDIYVEELYYKEMVRYFADPFLFAKKTLTEVLRYDWQSYDSRLQKIRFLTVDFQKYENLIESENFFEDISGFINYVENVIDDLEKTEKHRNKDFSVNEYGQHWSIYNNMIKHRLWNDLQLLKMISKKYLLLTKEAGQGKTNFLCDFTVNFLLKKGYYVLYFNASYFSDNPMTAILHFLTIHEQYDISYAAKILQKEFKKTKRPFFIVIDGLNENSIIESFGNTIRTFLEKCEEYPFIKVLMTTRSEFLEEKFGMLKDGLYQDKYEVIPMRNPYKGFNSRIFWGYLNYFDISIVENSLTNSTFKKLTHDLLLLRFFCEVNEHKKNVYMYDVFVYDVFKLYTDIKCTKYSENSTGINKDRVSHLLNDIISRMIKANNYSSVSTDEFSNDEIKLLNEMIDNEVIFKEESFNKSGLVNRKIETVGFTFDEYRDYCITNYLIYTYDEEELLSFLYQIEQEKSPVCEGVQKYVFYLSHTKHKNELKDIIKKIPEYEDLYWRHIEEIEEKYLDEDDIKKWMDQIIDNKPYIIDVIGIMVMRFDCTYYKKINIKNLMSILDEFLETSKDRFYFIVELFPFIENDDFRYYSQQIKYVCNYKDILQRISNDIDSNVPVECYEELVRFSVYILMNNEHDSCNLWEAFYNHNREKALEILKSLNSHRSSLIQANVARLLSTLLRKKSDNELQKLLDENGSTTPKGMDLSEFIKNMED